MLQALMDIVQYTGAICDWNVEIRFWVTDCGRDTLAGRSFTKPSHGLQSCTMQCPQQSLAWYKHRATGSRCCIRGSRPCYGAGSRPAACSKVGTGFSNNANDAAVCSRAGSDKTARRNIPEWSVPGQAAAAEHARPPDKAGTVWSGMQASFSSTECLQGCLLS